MKKVVLILLSLAMLLPICAGGKPDTAQISSSQKIQLEMYYYKQENQEGLKNLVKVFEKENPDITISMLVVPNDADAMMSARAAQGKLPDILQMQSYSRVQEYAKAGYLVDLTNTPVMQKVVPASLPSVTYNGKQYALPMDYAGIGIIYNKDIFAKYNLKPPVTYRELERVAATLTQNGIVPFAGLLKENWSVGHFITMVHTALLQETGLTPDQFIAAMNAGNGNYGAVDTAKLFSVLDFYRANMNKNAEEMGGGEQQQSFAKGESAMMVQGLWSYVDALKLNPKLNAGFIPFPIFNDATMNKLYADVDSCFGISSQSPKDKQAAALKFLEWLATPTAQKIWTEEYKLTLSFKGADVSVLGGPYVDMMNSVAEKGALPWLFAQYPTVVFEDGAKNGAQQYMMKKKPADKVISDINIQWKTAVGNVKK